jgi:hypothetical protein
MMRGRATVQLRGETEMDLAAAAKNLRPGV